MLLLPLLFLFRGFSSPFVNYTVLKWHYKSLWSTNLRFIGSGAIPTLKPIANNFGVYKLCTRIHLRPIRANAVPLSQADNVYAQRPTYSQSNLRSHAGSQMDKDFLLDKIRPASCCRPTLSN